MFQWLNGWFDNTPKSKKEKIEKVKADTAAKIVNKVQSKTSLMKLTKIQLEQLGRENGIELDRRKTKDKLVARLHKTLSKK